MCAKQSFVLAYRYALSGHSYYWTHEEDIHIAHIEDWSDCASMIRLHLEHMYCVKYCFAAAYKCQQSSFFGHTNPAHIVTSCDKSGRGCRQRDESILF